VRRGGRPTGSTAGSGEASEQRWPALGKPDAREALWEEDRSVLLFLDDVCACQANSPPHFKPAKQQPAPNALCREEPWPTLCDGDAWEPSLFLVKEGTRLPAQGQAQGLRQRRSPSATGLWTRLPVPYLWSKNKATSGNFKPIPL